MSANLVSLPDTASPVAQLALSVAGNTDDQGNGAATPFAALFQQLLGKAVAVDPALSLPLAPAETLPEGSTTEDAATELEALLPFLEAMGLLQAGESQTISQMPDPAASPIPQETSVAALLNPPVSSTTAISAASSEAAAAETPTVSTLMSDGSHDAGTPATTLSGQEVPAANMTAETSTVGHEFSQELHAAVEGIQEQAGQGSGNAVSSQAQGIGHLAPHMSEHSKTATLPVNQPVGSPGWHEDVGNQVVWMANRQESKAELVLTPPQMGRVEVSLSISGDNATASFVSGNPAVREALEAALPRLREVLAEAGIQLGQAQVGAENARQSAQQEKNGDNFGGQHAGQDQDVVLNTVTNGPAMTSTLKSGRGLVDVFA